MNQHNKQPIPKGYKQTEVGIIPEDWLQLNLGNDFTLKARIGWQALTTKEYLQSGNYALVTGTDFDDNAINWSQCSFVSEWRYKQDRNIQLQVGDVLVTKDGTIGKIGYINKLPFPATLNSGVFVIRPKKIEFYPSYLFYILKSAFFDVFIKSITAGSTIIHLYQKDFVRFGFYAPLEKKEQIAIAKALSDADSLIQSIKQLIAKKQAIKTATMQQLLTGKIRLPEFAFHADGKPKGTKQSELGEIPEDWDIDKIGRLCKIITGSKNTQDQVRDGIYPFFVRSQTVERINSFSFDGEGVLTAGDGVGTGKIFHYINGKCDFHQRVYLMHDFCERLNALFFYKYFSQFFYARIMSMTAKSSVDSVRREMIENMLIVLPPSKEQTIIATILSDIDKEIEALEVRLSKAEQIKSGMMQELLTGKTRLI